MEGLVHIYCGDGKGKTTAAVGLSVRAAGAGRKVLFVQFFKNGNSAELGPLRRLEHVEVRVCETPYGFIWTMDEAERAAAGRDYTALLTGALASARDGVGLLVLDEVISVCNCGVVPEETLLAFLRDRPEGLEVVLTGRDPSEALLDAADYVTEMRKIKHPYDRGIQARRGIEF